MLRRFYSTAGRTSIPRILMTAVILALVFFAVSQVDWGWGLVPNVVAGAIGGAVAAKFLVEAVRRLRDAGISRRVAAWIALALGALTGAALLAFLSDDPPWADYVLTAAGYLVPLLVAIALLWPPRASAGGRTGGSEKAGLAIAGLLTVAGALAMGFIAWLSIGMDAANRRAAAIEAKRNAASR